MAEPTTEIVVSSQPVNKCSCSTTLKTEPTTEVTLSSQPVKECSCSSEVIISPKSLKEPLSCIEDDELLDGLQALLKIFLALNSHPCKDLAKAEKGRTFMENGRRKKDE
ncbi:hypothetical protein EGR_09818 [Echinococcus granulosus]|uniref:Uncharacterized protein n=1 Tax=Echinococcus granulosus TaxID=6210 RepID=W6U2M4_ECHGR|nr:hypothetical protein EGR_09818 [Echinococcus granulosus]EUB55323.1 hypothetical protein EGR_09818 [Echinococcus granulosus]